VCQCQQQLLTADEAAPILGKTPSWLNEEARLRRVPFTMMGRSYRWTSAQLAEIIASREIRPQLEQPSRAPALRRVPEPAAIPETLLTARIPRRLRAASEPAA
jgi:hypothetical protein